MTKKYYERERVQTETGLRYVVVASDSGNTTVVAEGEDPGDTSKRVQIPTKLLHRVPKFELDDIVYFEHRPTSPGMSVGVVVARDVENQYVFVRLFGGRHVYRVANGFVEKISDDARKELSTRGLD